LKRALILGIGGQDGYYLTRLLRDKRYDVWGVLLPQDLTQTTLESLQDDVVLMQGDISDEVFMARVLEEVRPAEIYNLAGISFIPLSWEQPGLVGRVNGAAPGQILELIRTNLPTARFFQAGSSEMFGHDPFGSPQNEKTPFRPDNPYASAKVFAAHLVRNYREHFGLFACTGILYNHESPRRDPRFVTRKITQAAASISRERCKDLVLGNIHARRDWSYAGDTVRAMWLMLQAERPADYVIGSGTLKSITDVLEIAFEAVGLDWRRHVRSDQSIYRPLETRPLLADPSKARRELAWEREVSFEELIRMMVEADLERDALEEE